MKQVDLRSFLKDTGSLPRDTTLLQESGLRTVWFHVKGGEQLPEHNVAGAISVLCLAGQCTLLAGSEQMQMSPNMLASLAPRVSHSVLAQQESLLLVAIADAVAMAPA
jgi:quercetin dioxygenase-like cupin family protein